MMRLFAAIFIVIAVVLIHLVYFAGSMSAVEKSTNYDTVFWVKYGYLN